MNIAHYAVDNSVRGACFYTFLPLNILVYECSIRVLK